MALRYSYFDDVKGRLVRGAQAGTFSNVSLTSIATTGGVTTLNSASTPGLRFTGSSSQNVILPNATSMSPGSLFIIQNRSTQSLLAKYFDSSAASSISPSSDQWFEVYDNTTPYGWDTGVVNNQASLQSQINTIVSGTALETVLTCVGTNTVYSTSAVFSFNPSNTVPDIEVFRNAGRQYLSPTGSITTGHYTKLNSTTIQFLSNLVDGDKVIIRLQANSGGIDLNNIGVNPAPAISGSQTLGTNTRLWGGVWVKDLATGFAHEICVSGGVLTVI